MITSFLFLFILVKNSNASKVSLRIILHPFQQGALQVEAKVQGPACQLTVILDALPESKLDEAYERHPAVLREGEEKLKEREQAESIALLNEQVQ